MCHALLQDPRFFQLLYYADEVLANETRSLGCACGGVLHRANYPRKPRACLNEMRALFSLRFSFCCSRCRRRTTSKSVRFLGRRVYLALAVVLAFTQSAGQKSTMARLACELNIPVWTLQRWREWWREQFPLTSLWQTTCARFMPPPETPLFPASLLERFAGDAAEALYRLLIYLSPITVKPTTIRLITLNEGR